MGGGNAQKSAMARAKKMEKANKPGGGSQLKTNQAAMSIKCTVCLQQFMCNSTEVQLKAHQESKHPKTELYTAFPHLKPE